MARRCLLEVERKFRSLAVRDLTRTGGTPNFASLQKLPPQTIRDAYFDRSGLLLASGAWVRKRDGEWQAKLRMGGNYNASRFEEISGADAIAACVRRVVTGVERPQADNNFGLDTVASFETRRETWVVDHDFHVVLDTMDFGHEVGEVELTREIELVGEDLTGESAATATTTTTTTTPAPLSVEVQKRMAMDEMDSRIIAFMERYSWAFTPGEPTGKLTAYFERMRQKD